MFSSKWMQYHIWLNYNISCRWVVIRYFNMEIRIRSLKYQNIGWGRGWCARCGAAGLNSGGSWQPGKTKKQTKWSANRWTSASSLLLLLFASFAASFKVKTPSERFSFLWSKQRDPGWLGKQKLQIWSQFGAFSVVVASSIEIWLCETSLLCSLSSLLCISKPDHRRSGHKSRAKVLYAVPVPDVDGRVSHRRSPICCR